jgi:exopolyphosphatase/pppGpp-phosphohydrolase
MKIIIDIGSSTIKVYRIEHSIIKNVEKHSIFFKNGFTRKDGLSAENEKEFLNFLSQIRNKNVQLKITAYATSLFRKMSKLAQENITKKILETAGINLKIISHKQESHYLQQALIGKFKKGTVLITNIGGGSTELVLIKDGVTIQTYELENLGVGTILGRYPEINATFSGVTLDKLTKEIIEKLPKIGTEIAAVFFTGGELTYMKLANYNLQRNILFEDINHPYILSTKDCKKRNSEIFSKVTIKELEKLMPENPKWMHGARAYIGIAQAITNKYSIQTIIPSDTNLVDGIVLNK